MDQDYTCVLIEGYPPEGTDLPKFEPGTDYDPFKEVQNDFV